MRQHAKELEEHQDRIIPADFIAKRIKSITQMQGDNHRYLELCYDDKTLVGFLHGKIDRSEHKGFVKAGFGCIMEFFVLPSYRRIL